MDFQLRHSTPLLANWHKLLAIFAILYPPLWLYAPNIVIIFVDPALGLHLKTLGLTLLFICTIPILLLISKNLRQFYLWNIPFALVSGEYSEFILNYHDIPYDGMWFAFWNTSIDTILGLVLYYVQDAYLAIIAFLLYIACVFHPLYKSIRFTKTLKQYSLLSSLMIIFIFMSLTNFFSKKIAVQRIIDESIIFKNYPYGMVIMLIKTKLAFSKNNKAPLPKIKRNDIPQGREIIVLVIGEAARYDTWLKVSKKTNSSLLMNPNIQIFNDAVSQANLTSISLPLMLTGATTMQEANAHRIWPRIAKAAGCSTGWITNSTEPYDYPYKNDFYDLNVDRFALVGFSAVVYDEVLLPEINRALTQGPEKLCLVVHLIGSHFDYRERYRADLAKYPVDSLAYKDTTHPDHLLAFRNAYSNSLIETNHVLENIIKLLAQQNAISFLLYAADHAESFDEGENHQYFHGNFHPSKQEMHIAFFVWSNQQFQKRYPAKWAALKINKFKKISNNQILPTLMDVLSISAIPIYLKPSLLSPYKNNVERMVLLPQMDLISYEALN